jgi:endonuclease/exonuclease/phosphatase (EEP) superfamily protein YafD
MFADLLGKEEHPIVLAGDFNCTNRSPYASALRNIDLRDVHTQAGFGRGATWPVSGFFRRLPGLRLDHIFLSDALTCTESRTGTGTGSDHRPVVARIAFKE